MNKYDHYKKLIRDRFIAHYQRLTSVGPLKREVNMALDDEYGQYVIFKTGWHGQEYYRSFFLHVALRQGKIHIEEDRTEDGLASDLLCLGVLREDIVLAFQPPEIQHYPDLVVI